MTAHLLARSQGADVIGAGVRYRTWSDHERIEALIVDEVGEVLRPLSLTRKQEGYFEGVDELGRAGDLYRYRINGGDHWPDPASRWQPEGVHGPSMVIDPANFAWTDSGWSAPERDGLIIYELHVGAFTPAGTFRSASERLGYLVELGVTAVELMPIGDFPGERNWGYDGVSLYAPSRAYGTPDDLRALVDAAHGRGLAVILDVVYNHLGPDGNYTGLFSSRYLNPQHKTPWGDGFNFELAPVRAFFAENPEYWQREFHIDGFRLDATHAIQDFSERHILAEIAERVQRGGGFVIAEDERNEPQLLQARERGGLGLDAVWADDFHHVVRVMLTGERQAYFANFEGTPNELATTLRNGWLFAGQAQKTSGARRGGDASQFAPAQFVFCISNHDQVGNRAFGERLSHIVEPAAYRAASALLCLVPYTPMLFMGQEWAASTPFQFFTEHEPELGKKITAGRRREFSGFAEFTNAKLLEKIPDPQAEATFNASKLNWSERPADLHAGVLLLYRECLGLRRKHRAFQESARDQWRIVEHDRGIIAIAFGRCAVLVDLIGGHDSGFAQLGFASEPRLIFDSNAARFGGAGEAPFSIPTVAVVEAGE